MISPIENEVLRHIHTYRITVPIAIARLYELSLEQAGEILTALHTKRLLGSAELMPGENYFYLQPRAAEPLGIGKIDSGPVNVSVKISAYATLYFCCISGDYRPKIPTDVFKNRFAQLYRPGPKINYYTDGPAVGYLRVETNASLTGDVFRLIERCRRDITKRTTKSKAGGSQFRELFEAGRFSVTVLTAFPQKAERVQRELNRMTELRSQYLSYLEVSEGGKKFAPKNLHLEYTRWHHKKPDRKEPAPPPAMKIFAVPKLIDLIYPKLEPVVPA